MYCVIPAAGKGVRFKELGKHYPKCILPYQEIPIIVHNIRLALRLGARVISVVIGHQADKVKDTVKQYFPNDDRIVFFKYCPVVDKEGPGVSIYRGIIDIEDEPLLILLSDIVVKSGITNLGTTSWISTQTVADWDRWCMAENSGRFITKFYDKPINKPPTTSAVSGVYYFTDGKKFDRCLDEAIYSTQDGEVQISTAMSLYMKSDCIATKSLDIIDFGTLNEYLENRGIKKSRDFNNVIVNKKTITKSSIIRPDKIHSEVNWYSNLPIDISSLTPRIYGKDLYSETPSYTMERINKPTLRELFLYIDYDPNFWRNIFNGLFDIIDLLYTYKKPGKSDFFVKMYAKCIERLSDISNDIAPKKELELFLNTFEQELFINDSFNEFEDSLFHGDLCFSNIFYDPDKNDFKLIDPRGDSYGNILYDLAKITHSAYYYYDYIDAELYMINDKQVTLFNDGKEAVRQLYKKMFIEKYGETLWHTNLFVTSMLYITMIALHNHNPINQRLFYENYREAFTESGFVSKNNSNGS